MAIFNFTNTGNIDNYLIGSSTNPEIIPTDVFLRTVDQPILDAYLGSISGTYNKTTATTSNLTVSSNSHGYNVGDRVYLDFTSGSEQDKYFTILAVPSLNSFTVTDSSLSGASGNVKIYPDVISPLNLPPSLYSKSVGFGVGETLSEFKSEYKDLANKLATPSNWRVVDVDRRGDVWGIKFADASGNAIRLYGQVTQTNVQPNSSDFDGHVNFAVTGTRLEYEIGTNENFLLASSAFTVNFRQDFNSDKVAYNTDIYGKTLELMVHC